MAIGFRHGLAATFFVAMHTELEEGQVSGIDQENLTSFLRPIEAWYYISPAVRWSVKEYATMISAPVALYQRSSGSPSPKISNVRRLWTLESHVRVEMEKVVSRAGINAETQRIFRSTDVYRAARYEGVVKVLDKPMKDRLPT